MNHLKTKLLKFNAMYAFVNRKYAIFLTEMCENCALVVVMEGLLAVYPEGLHMAPALSPWRFVFGGMQIIVWAILGCFNIHIIQ